MDKYKIYELALNAIGEKEYRADSPNAKPCEIEFDTVLRECLSRYAWTFARKLITLSPNESPESGIYPLPVDCLRLLSLSPAYDFQLIGEQLHIPESSGELTLLYISDDIARRGEIPDRYPAFCRGVICLLASRITMAVTGQMQLVAHMEELSARHLATAITKDRQQDASNDQDPFARIAESSIY